MRFYSFVNYYLSPLQHGLQTAHCVSEMTTVYAPDSPHIAKWIEWAEDHKTIIICNGGNAEALENLHYQLGQLCDPFGLPVIAFNEDEQSLNGAITAVGAILPAWVYESVFMPGEADIRRACYIWRNGSHSIVFDVESKEAKLIELVRSHRLA